MRTRVVSALPYWVLDAFAHQRPEIGKTLTGAAAPAAGIVFSRDRPMQLDALLRSYGSMVQNPAALQVIYSTSSPAYTTAYRDLIAGQADREIAFHDEKEKGGFAPCLHEVLNGVSAKTVFFLVDDILFIRAIDLTAFAALATPSVIPSLRLGRNIVHSYTTSSRQLHPHMKRVTLASHSTSDSPSGLPDRLWCWRWRSGVKDWNYPYSLDGNIFITAELRDRLSRMEFTSPNSLEAALHALFRNENDLWGICFDHSRIVNSPVNRVQNEVDNLAGHCHQDELLAQWERGLRWDTSGLDQISTSSVHEEIALEARLIPER